MKRLVVVVLIAFLIVVLFGVFFGKNIKERIFEISEEESGLVKENVTI